MTFRTLSKRFCIWATLATIVLAIGLTAPAMVQGQSNSPIRVGFLTALTGVLAQNGVDIAEGVKLYFSEIEYTVAGRKINLITEDTASSVNTGLTKAKKLITRNRVQVILGPVHSGIGMAVRNLVHSQKVPMVITQATANALTQSKASPYIFRTAYSSGQLHLPIGRYLYKTLGWKRIAVLALDYVAGHEHAGGIIKSFKEAGGEVALELYPNLGAADVAPYLTKIKGSMDKLDGVVAYLWSPTAIHFIKGYTEYGLKGKLPIFAHGATMDESFLPTMGDAALGVLSPDVWSRVLDNPENKRFIKATQAAYKRRPSKSHELGYTAAKAVGEALKAINGDIENQKKFLNALRKIRFRSPRGDVRFDDKQNVVVPVYVREVRQVNGVLENVVIANFPDIDQFWTPKK